MNLFFIINFKRSSYKKRKKGFTLIELIIVIAIIAILATIAVPRFAAYKKQADKTKALSEVRQVVLAVDVYNINSDVQIGNEEIYEDIKNKGNISDYLDVNSITNIKSDMKYSEMKKILNGSNSDFDLDENKKIVVK